VVDESGRIALVNHRTEELFGFRTGELIGRHVETLIPELLNSAPGRELDGRREDGSEFPIEVTLGPIAEESQELVLATVHDVSDRRAAEHESAELARVTGEERDRAELARERAAHAQAESGRERLASILGEIDAIVWEADARRHRFSFVSKRAVDMLGYPLDAWLKEDDFWKRIVEPEDLPLAELYFQEAIGHARDHDHEYRARTATGEVVWLRDRVRVAPGDDMESRLHGVTVDVTARRELEERLIQSQKMDAVGQLAGGVAHDFNNLLVVISGYTDLLLGRVTDETSLIPLQEISQASGRAGELVAQLLAFGRRAPNITELVDLGTLIRRIEPMLRRLIDHDIALAVDIAENLPRVRADAGQLEQVLVNLVINARDALPHGGEIRMGVEHAALDETHAAEQGLTAGEWVTLTVADNGSGMKSETRERIFEPFFTTKAPGKGTGLGLSTVFGIVEEASGTITVDTELGRGTTFSIHLRARSGAAEEPAEPDATGADRVVLVVEDESAVRRLVRSVLEEAGYRVHEAANGRDALAYIEHKSSEIDLVLTDVAMPDLSGPELVARLAPLRPSPRVLFMSGYADSQLLKRGLDERAIGVLRKPFTPSELAARVAAVMSEGEPNTPDA
jgi:PAS domain S-box-containing protein